MSGVGKTGGQGGLPPVDPNLSRPAAAGGNAPSSPVSQNPNVMTEAKIKSLFGDEATRRISTDPQTGQKYLKLVGGTSQKMPERTSEDRLMRRLRTDENLGQGVRLERSETKQSVVSNLKEIGLLKNTFREAKSALAATVVKIINSVPVQALLKLVSDFKLKGFENPFSRQTKTPRLAASSSKVLPGTTGEGRVDRAKRNAFIEKLFFPNRFVTEKTDGKEKGRAAVGEAKGKNSIQQKQLGIEKKDLENAKQTLWQNRRDRLSENDPLPLPTSDEDAVKYLLDYEKPGKTIVFEDKAGDYQAAIKDKDGSVNITNLTDLSDEVFEEVLTGKKNETTQKFEGGILQGEFLAEKAHPESYNKHIQDALEKGQNVRFRYEPPSQ